MQQQHNGASNARAILVVLMMLIAVIATAVAYFSSSYTSSVEQKVQSFGRGTRIPAEEPASCHAYRAAVKAGLSESFLPKLARTCARDRDPLYEPIRLVAQALGYVFGFLFGAVLLAAWILGLWLTPSRRPRPHPR